MKKVIIIYLVCLFVTSLSAKTFIREYTYNASEADSKLTSRAISLEQVKRLLLQEIGVYVHSTILNEEVEVSGELKELTAKQIEIISAGITETKIIEETWNGEIYYIKAEITADEKDVLKKLDKVINDKEKTKQLEESRRKTDEALAEINRLKQQLAQTKDENEKLQLQNNYNQSSNELTAEDWFAKGINAIEDSEFDKAILFFNKTLEIDSSAISAYYNLGILSNQIGEYNRSINYFTAISLLYPEYIDSDYYSQVNYNMGLTYLKNKNHQEAKKCFLIAIEHNPNYAFAHKALGQIYGTNNEHDKALESFSKALEIDPNFVGVYVDLGITYIALGETKKGIQCFNKVIELNPDNKHAYYGLGIVYQKESNYDKAIKFYNKAIDIDFNFAKAFHNMGVSYQHNGMYEKGIECIKNAARLGLINSQEYLIEKGISW